MIKFTHMRTPLNRYTFKNKRLKKWVEDRCVEDVSNLFEEQIATTNRFLRSKETS